MRLSPAHPRRWRAVHWFGAAIGVLVAVVVVGLVSGLVALNRLAGSRTLLVDRLDPAVTTAFRLSDALLDQDRALRGYVRTRDEAFLRPYRRGGAEERRASRRLLRLTGGLEPRVGRAAAAVRRAGDTWRANHAEPVIAAARRGRGPVAPAEEARGRALFEQARTHATTLQTALGGERAAARDQLRRAADTTRRILIGFGAALGMSVLAAALLLRRVLVAPIGRLAAEVRAVAHGDFERRVSATGAREVVMLGADVDAMRTRILRERDELQRSNAELEQFAYVASHDLQEPLRKVASFTQMLQRRYEGRLDERADTYIAFAVDGAKRMQELINDLLAFSRVGRVGQSQVVVDCGELVARALASLSPAIEDTGAVVEVGELPRVRGEASLLGMVFQNLIANGLKFRGPGEPPRISVQAQRAGDFWRFTVADNGIGIEPEYADRIFVIFQRLHPRSDYEGTGIGLAMCRKVVEYHGGRIWLDTTREQGATFHFTLPAIDDDPPEEPPAP